MNLRNLQLSNDPLETVREQIAPLCKLKLDKRILDCSKCSTCSRDKSATSGNPNADILIITDYATNIQENIDYLKYLLNESNLAEDDYFIINAVSCVCYRQDKDKLIERMPSLEELKNCKEYVINAIKFVNPKIIISMGATALNQFSPDNVRIVDNINKNTYYFGKFTLITNSVREISDFCDIFSESEVDELINGVVDTFNKAKKYIEEGK